MADCDGFGGWINCKIGDAAGAVASSASGRLAEDMMAGWDSITKGFLTSWLKVGVLVDLDTGSVAWLTEQLEVISVFLAVIGLMVAAIWTMVHQRGEKAVQVAKALFRVMLVTTAGVGLIQVVLAGGDAFSTWILESAGITVDARGQIPVGTLVATSPGLAILAGIFGIIATLIQWGIMLVRSALIPLLVGVWPVAAAASMIGGAEQAFSRITTWIIAFTLYKPVAAVVYAYAWKTKSGDDGIGGVINGLVLIILAVVALPAMMRLLAPGTAALGGSGGGSLALAGGAALVGAGVAAGTAVLTGGGSAAAGGVAATAGTAKSTQATGTGPSTAGGTGPAGPSGMDGGSSSGGPAGGSGSGGTGAGTVGGDPASGGTGAQTVGADGAAGGAGSTGSGTIGGDAAAGGAGAGAVGVDRTAGGANQPTSADAGSTGSSGSAGTAAGTPTGAAPEAAPAPRGTGNQSSRGRQAGGAAARSLGEAVADGVRDADGKGVIGE